MMRILPRLRFSLRTLLVMVTVFCVWLGCQVKTVRNRVEMRRVILTDDDVKFLNGDVGGNVAIVRYGNHELQPTLVRRMLGDHAVYAIFFDRFTADQDLKRIEYFPEAAVYERAKNPKAWTLPGDNP